MSSVNPGKKGMVIIQIDGLSYDRLTKAIKTGKVPFIRKLLRKRTMRLHKYLSEIPTSTPAFQAGMFYGDNDNIPGFAFYDKKEQRVYHMGNSDCAYSVQQQFKNPGLLSRGSVFSCVYNGNAEASLFIFSSLLAPQRWRFALRIWDIFLLTMLNIALIIKLIFQSIIEIAVGLYDMVKRVMEHGHLKREIEIVGIRVGLSLISRELITLGAVIDIFRRVPTIYVNYLSYDEHAHLRGPNSRFAFWTLRHIDTSIRRIEMATRYSEREYDVYILSDHGQCAVRPFELVAGESLGEYMQSELTDMVVENYWQDNERIVQMMLTADATNRLAQSMPWLLRWPVRWYSNYLRNQLSEAQMGEHLREMLEVSVVSTGPIAYVYWTRQSDSLTENMIEDQHPGLLDRIVEHKAISFISVRMADGGVRIRSRCGEVICTEQNFEQRGSMPFDDSVNKDHVVRGIARLTRFPRAGDICIWGGNSPSGNISYGFEFGAHSGWTDDETQAFIIAPMEIDYEFSKIRRHSQFYDFFSRYRCDEETETQATETERVVTASAA